MYVVPTGPPSHLPRLRFPHPRYRIIFIGGPKSRGRNFKISPCTHRTGSALAHRTAGPNGQTNEVRGGGSCRGRSMRIVGPSDIRSGQAHRADVRCTDRAAIASPSPPLSSPSVPHHLYRGAEIEGPKF